jgi:hypothetical protein
MGSPDNETLAVRITCVGRASRRWRSTTSSAAAASLNQRLSEHRAKTIYDYVESIVKVELPNLPIALREKALGSTSPFPTASEDNAAVDRSVLLMVDLVRTRSAEKIVPRAPRRVYVPSIYWTLKVVGLVGATGVGFRPSLLRVTIRNPLSGKELSLSGPIFGGDLDISPGMFKKIPKVKPFKFDKPTDILKQLHDGQVGKEVSFDTPLMDFDDWINGASGQLVRVVHTHIKTGVTKTQTTFLQFVSVDTHPGSLVFDLKKLGFRLGMPDLDIQVQSGILTADNHPEDTVLTPTPDDRVPVQVITNHADGILVSFPTGKSSWKDLTSSQRDEIRRFLMNAVAGIRALADTSFDVVVPPP